MLSGKKKNAFQNSNQFHAIWIKKKNCFPELRTSLC
jgi:hypothetical protein